MIRTKHAVIFVMLGVVFLVMLLMYVLSSLEPQGTEVSTPEVSFSGGKGDIGVAELPKKDKKSIKESLLSRLSFDWSDTEEQIPEEPVSDASTDSGTDFEEEGETETSGMATLPVVTIETGGQTQVGTHGSYCWHGVCADAVVTDVPYAPLVLRGTSTVRFSIFSDVAPERVLFFLRDITEAEVAQTGELSSLEIQNGVFELAPTPGEHLLLVTGVWPLGEDVVNVFKVRFEKEVESTATSSENVMNVEE